jgi:hypothetical protein
MKITVKLAVLVAALALIALPGFAAGAQPADPGSQGQAHVQGPKDGLPAKAKAHGRRCKGLSKKHVKGEKGTPFSRCVKAAAKADHASEPDPSPTP